MLYISCRFILLVTLSLQYLYSLCVHRIFFLYVVYRFLSIRERPGGMSPLASTVPSCPVIFVAHKHSQLLRLQHSHTASPQASFHPVFRAL